jgi:hypothetical protein
MKMAYLILDEFPVHLTSKVGQAFVDLNTEIEVIPEGQQALKALLLVSVQNMDGESY